MACEVAPVCCASSRYRFCTAGQCFHAGDFRVKTSLSLFLSLCLCTHTHIHTHTHTHTHSDDAVWSPWEIRLRASHPIITHTTPLINMCCHQSLLHLHTTYT